MHRTQDVSVTAPKEKVISFSDLKFEEVLASIGLAIIVLAVSWGVVTRYVLAQPANWTGEVAGIAFTWTAFVGAAAVFARGEHISIDLLLHYLPEPLRSFTQLVADVIVFAALAVVAFLAIRFSIATLDVPTTILRVPETVIYSGAAVGFSLMAIRHAIFVAQLWRAGSPLQVSKAHGLLEKAGGIE
jgi:TRAP-type transport system small permease protein